MSVDSKKIFGRLAGNEKSDRERVSLYLSGSLLKEFKETCGDFSPSKVMEELMREFINSAKKKK